MRVALACIVLVAACVRIILAFLPLSSLITHVTPDDAYYYFGIARNVSRGNGVSFDGHVTSNGFHPLWMIAVIISYALPVSNAISLRVALSCSAIVAALGCIPLASLTVSLTKRPPYGLAVAAAYALCPAAALFSVNGLETGFLLTAFILSAERFYRVLSHDDPFSAITFGVSGAVLILSRTDYAIFFGMMLVGAAAGGRKSAALRSGMVATLCTLPWFGWEFVATGTLLQSSAQAVPLVAHGNGPHGLSAVRHGLTLWRETWWRRIPDDYFFRGLPRIISVIGSIALAGIFARVVVSRRSERPARALFIGLGAGFVVLSFIHAGVRWYFREWYLPTLIPTALVAMAVVCSNVANQQWRKVAAATGTGIVMCLFAAAARNAWSQPRYAIQGDMLAAARWIDANASRGDVVAGVNAGIVGYVGNRETVDLDGVVDGDALSAVRDHRLRDYLDRRCVSYVAEFPFYVFWYGSYWGGNVSERLALDAAFSSGRRYQPPEIASDFSVWSYRADNALCNDPTR